MPGAGRPALLSAPGLTSAEAAARLARDGPNWIVPEARAHRVARLLGPLADPMVLLLLVAAPTYLAIGETTDAVVAFIALVPVAAVGWLLEARAERTLERLRALAAPMATVVRDGDAIEVATEDLVVGDLVWLHEGAVVPADGLVESSTQLLVDEAALTGESLPVAKEVGDELWAGTTVRSGRAAVVLTATGPATRYGRIGGLLARVHQPPTPLQHALGRLVRVLAVLAVAFCAAVVGAELVHGEGWGQAVIAGVSLAIAAIPEEFSVVYTLYLAVGAWRLAQQRALVRRLPSVETLGSTTVICTDKTGTLTLGTLTVAGTWAPGGDDDERVLLDAAVLACEPEPFDPLDVAVLTHARERGVDVAALHAAELVTDWPFDAAGKHLTHVWRLPDGSVRIAAKGSLEGVLARGAIDGATRDATLAAHERFAADGMRLIAVAGGVAAGPSGDRATDEAHLVFRGLVAFSDPVRVGVADALAECRAAGVRVIMITGDHPATAHAVAEGLDLPHQVDGADVIATGDDLDGADAAMLDRLAATAGIFARTRPEQKHLLVETLRRRGEVVAMTGDGINDAPALREADIGVAMGERGSDVAREAASLVLLDDNFATIVAAVRGGRRIFDNLTRAFAYLIAFHPPLLIAALVVPLLDRPLLLLPIHLVVLELVLHPVVSLLFQADPADRDVMQRPPRPVGDALRPRALWRPYAVGSVFGVAVVSLFLLALHAGWPADQARAMGFATVLAGQPFLLLGMRRPREPIWAPGATWTRTLVAVLAVLALTTVAVVDVPPLADVLQLRAFPAGWWAVVVAVAAGSTLWAEPLKHRAGRRRH